MIRLSFSVAVAVYLLALLAVLFGLWFFLELKKKSGSSQKAGRKLWKCSICSDHYWSEEGSEITRCPSCHSLNKPEDL